MTATPQPPPETTTVTGKPPWWRWYEPPGCWPGWLHKLTCTYCRGFARYVRKLEKGES